MYRVVSCIMIQNTTRYSNRAAAGSCGYLQKEERKKLLTQDTSQDDRASSTPRSGGELARSALAICFESRGPLKVPRTDVNVKKKQARDCFFSERQEQKISDFLGAEADPAQFVLLFRETESRKDAKKYFRSTA